LKDLLVRISIGSIGGAVAQRFVIVDSDKIERPPKLYIRRGRDRLEMIFCISELARVGRARGRYYRHPLRGIGFRGELAVFGREHEHFCVVLLRHRCPLRPEGIDAGKKGADIKISACDRIVRHVLAGAVIYDELRFPNDLQAEPVRDIGQCTEVRGVATTGRYGGVVNDASISLVLRLTGIKATRVIVLTPYVL
jgi:hypothetical protein